MVSLSTGPKTWMFWIAFSHVLIEAIKKRIRGVPWEQASGSLASGTQCGPDLWLKSRPSRNNRVFSLKTLQNLYASVRSRRAPPMPSFTRHNHVFRYLNLANLLCLLFLIVHKENALLFFSVLILQCPSNFTQYFC